MQPFRKEVQGHLTHTEEKAMRWCNRERFEDSGLEDWSDVATSQGSWQLPAAEESRNTFSLQASRGSTDLLIP